MPPLPMFPLGTVLLPTAVLPLHIFEPRYRALMAELTDGPDAPGEFGVVLISRGSEVGGGDVRVATGTVARLLEATMLPDGRWVVAVVGSRRIHVDRWLPDDPYPRADVTDLDEDPARIDDHVELVAGAERAVRRSLALAAELGEDVPPATFRLADDAAGAAWQLAAALPVGPLDRQRLLDAPSVASRLELVRDMAGEIADVLAFRLAGEQ